MLEHEKKILSKAKDEKNFSKSKKISQDLISLSSNQNELQKKIDVILSNIPNIAVDDVPVG